MLDVMDVGVVGSADEDGRVGVSAPGHIGAAVFGRPLWWRLLTAGIVVLALGVLVVVAVDVAGAGAPGAIVHLTISQAGLTPLAPVFDTAVLMIAAGCAVVLTVAVGLRRADRLPWRVGAVAGAVAVAGFVLVASFTKQDWSQPTAMSGTIHRLGSLMAFVALPVAVIALARRARVARRLAAAAIVAAALGMASFLPVVIAIMAVGMSGGWWLVVPLGLIERTIALSDMAALGLLAVLCARELRHLSR